MACHQHRCCRRPVGAALASETSALDYVLLSTDDVEVLEALTAALINAGSAPAQHDLGLRLDCRGASWKAALSDVCDILSPPARAAVRVALIPVASDMRLFHRALLSSRPLDAFARSLPMKPATTTPSRLLSDVFKGESLE